MFFIICITDGKGVPFLFVYLFTLNIPFTTYNSWTFLILSFISQYSSKILSSPELPTHYIPGRLFHFCTPLKLVLSLELFQYSYTVILRTYPLQHDRSPCLPSLIPLWQLFTQMCPFTPVSTFRNQSSIPLITKRLSEPSCDYK